MAKREFSMDQLIDRAKALTVACQYCGSPVDIECMRTDYKTGKKFPVENFPAHFSRIKRAERAQRMAADQLTAIPNYENPIFPTEGQ